MKLVMTLLARDEADIVDAQIAFHLNVGVDFVVAIDNGSEDATTEILETYEREGYLNLSRDDGSYRQAAWVTEMARRAATEFGADWVINSDADEFWWPRGGSLKDILSAVPERFGTVRGMWRHFAPRPDGAEFFAERMTVRVCNPGARSTSPYSPRFKAAHRAHPEVTVLGGNHRALGRGLDPLPGWYPIDVLHFPIRSLQQFEEKYLRWWQVLRTEIGTAAQEAHAEGRMREFYESWVVDDRRLAQGLEDGTLAVDDRLRQALGALRTGNRRGLPAFQLPSDASALSVADSAVDDAYLCELAVLEEATDPLLRSERRVEQLEARLVALEAGVPSRVWSALRRVTPAS